MRFSFFFYSLKVIEVMSVFVLKFRMMLSYFGGYFCSRVSIVLMNSGVVVIVFYRIVLFKLDFCVFIFLFFMLFFCCDFGDGVVLCIFWCVVC